MVHSRKRLEDHNCGRIGLVNDILQEVLLCEGRNDSCVRVALFIVWRMLMLNYETERKEALRYRNNNHDFNCEGRNDSSWHETENSMHLSMLSCWGGRPGIGGAFN